MVRVHLFYHGIVSVTEFASRAGARDWFDAALIDPKGLEFAALYDNVGLAMSWHRPIEQPTPEPVYVGALIDRIAALVAAHLDGLMSTDIAAILGANHNTVRGYLGKLIRARKIVREGCLYFSK